MTQQLTRPQAKILAQKMYENGEGWSIPEIRRYLADRGQHAAWSTVKGWADPEWWQRRQDAHRRRWRERNVGPQGATPDLLLSLRVEDGLAYSAIAKVVNRFFGEELTEDQVRYRLYDLGAPKNPNKSRANETRSTERLAA